MVETEDYDKSTTPAAHKTSHQDGGADEISVEGLAGELTAEQKSAWSKVSGKPTTFAPEAHKTSHQLTGSDALSVAGLSGLLADGQTPLAHKTSHQLLGADALSVAGLSGVLADDQHIIDTEAVSAMGTKANSNPLNHDRYADSEALAAAVQSGAITDAVTKAPTHDAVYDVKVMTEAHKTRHQDAGDDEISVAGLSGLLADPQTPLIDEGDWIAPTLENGWVNEGGTSEPAGYYKDLLGWVHVRGIVKNGTIGLTIFTLPVGYRSSYNPMCVIPSNAAFGIMRTEPNGSTYCSTGNNAWVSMSPFMFRAG